MVRGTTRTNFRIGGLGWTCTVLVLTFRALRLRVAGFCVYIYIYINRYVRMYIYICMYVNIYIYVYVYLHVHGRLEMSLTPEMLGLSQDPGNN